MAKKSPVLDDATLEKLVLIKGYATKRQIREAYRAQEVMKSKGQKVSLGEVMISRRYLTNTQLKRLQAEVDKDKEDVYPVIEGYSIEKKLRKGGMGTVYKARQVSMDRVVALKVLAPELTDDKTYVKRFFTEAKAVGKLSHKNVVSGIDVGQSNGFYYFAMEYINGETVLELMKREKVLQLSFALTVTYQTAEALKHAEKHRIIHRDIKPGNIMINHHGTVKLCDLGFAKISNIDLLTKAGTTLGTPYYMSPEQCRGLQDIDIRSDVYSLGATLYHMLVGKVPFNGRTASEILKKHLSQELVIPQETRARIGEHMCYVIEKMMAKDRNKRYQSPAEVLEDLDPVIARFNAPPILIIRASDACCVQDIALLLAEGAYLEGVKVDLVTGKELTDKHLEQAGAIVLGAPAVSSGVAPEVKMVLKKIARSAHVRGKLGAAFIGLPEDQAYKSTSRQLTFIMQEMIASGLMVQAVYKGALGGFEPLSDMESPEAEDCRVFGKELAQVLIKLTPGKPLLKNLTSS